MQIIDWQNLDAAGRSEALARPRLEARRRHRHAGALDHPRSAQGWRCGAAALCGALRSRHADVAEGHACRVRCGGAARSSPRRSRRIETAIDNVRRFHAAQLGAPLSMEVMPGVRCERVFRPIPAVGLYVPAGSAPTALHRDHGGRSGAAGRLSAARAVHAAHRQRRRQCRGAGGCAPLRRRQCVQGRRCAGHRGHGLWHANRCPRWTRSTVQAPPSRRRPSRSLRAIRRARPAICRPGLPKCW